MVPCLAGQDSQRSGCALKRESRRGWSLSSGRSRLALMLQEADACLWLLRGVLVAEGGLAGQSRPETPAWDASAVQRQPEGPSSSQRSRSDIAWEGCCQFGLRRTGPELRLAILRAA